MWLVLDDGIMGERARISILWGMYLCMCVAVWCVDISTRNHIAILRVCAIHYLKDFPTDLR